MSQAEPTCARQTAKYGAWSLSYRVYMACISRIVNETYIIRVERVTHWGKGDRPRIYYSIILLFLYTAFQSNYVPHPAFYTWLWALWGQRPFFSCTFTAAETMRSCPWWRLLQTRDANGAWMLTGRARGCSPAEMLLDNRVEGLFACLALSKLVGVLSWPSKEYLHDILKLDSSFLCQRCGILGNAHQ